MTNEDDGEKKYQLLQIAALLKILSQSRTDAEVIEAGKAGSDFAGRIDPCRVLTAAEITEVFHPSSVMERTPSIDTLYRHQRARVIAVVTAQMLLVARHLVPLRLSEEEIHAIIDAAAAAINGDEPKG